MWVSRRWEPAPDQNNSRRKHSTRELYNQEPRPHENLPKTLTTSIYRSNTQLGEQQWLISKLESCLTTGLESKEVSAYNTCIVVHVPECTLSILNSGTCTRGSCLNHQTDICDPKPLSKPLQQAELDDSHQNLSKLNPLLLRWHTHSHKP